MTRPESGTQKATTPTAKKPPSAFTISMAISPFDSLARAVGVVWANRNKTMSNFTPNPTHRIVEHEDESTAPPDSLFDLYERLDDEIDPEALAEQRGAAKERERVMGVYSRGGVDWAIQRLDWLYAEFVKTDGRHTDALAINHARDIIRNLIGVAGEMKGGE